MDDDTLNYNGAQDNLGAELLSAGDKIAAQQATIAKLQGEMEESITRYRTHITTLLDIIKNLQDGQTGTTLK